EARLQVHADNGCLRSHQVAQVDRSNRLNDSRLPKQAMAAHSKLVDNAKPGYDATWVIFLAACYTHGPNSIRDKKTTLGLAQILVERGWLVPVNTHQHNMRAWKIVRRSTLIAGAAGAAPGAATTFCNQMVDKYLLF